MKLNREQVLKILPKHKTKMTKKVEEFLRKRGIAEEIIEKTKNRYQISRLPSLLKEKILEGLDKKAISLHYSPFGYIEVKGICSITTEIDSKGKEREKIDCSVFEWWMSSLIGDKKSKRDFYIEDKNFESLSFEEWVNK